ncbi:MAG: AAA family ATPase [Bacteroidota bacterium]
MASKPVIFLGFANDKVDDAQYLRNLPLEMDGVRKSLYLAEQMGLCEVVERANLTIDQILNVFQDPRYRGRIAIFHYGGHANGYQLLLESLDKSNQAGNAHGLVPFLAAQDGLQLVFLNGCASRPQALELVEAGIPAVIGTAEPINDIIATKLSIRFYRGLANGLPMGRAWAEAEDEIKLNTPRESFKDVVFTREQLDKGDFHGLPWEFHIGQHKEQVKDWSLPSAIGDPLFGLPELPVDIQLPEEPFLFFKRYERKDAAVFFGRSAYIRELYHRVTDQDSPPLVLLFGQSGVGKSSLFDAGLRPRLEKIHHTVYLRRDADRGLIHTLGKAFQQPLDEMAIAPSEQATTSQLAPTLEHLLQQLEDSLQQLEEQSEGVDVAYLNKLKAMKAQSENMIQDLHQDQQSLADISKQRKAKYANLPDNAHPYHKSWLQLEAETDRPLVIILDQVEEVFTRPISQKDELREFLDLLESLFRNPAFLPDGKLIMGYRKEYHPEIDKECKERAIPRSQLFLERLKREELAEVVKGLTLNDKLRNRYQLTVEENLPGDIADDLLSDRDSAVAPILQILLTKMWRSATEENSHSPLFSSELYHSLRTEGILLDEFFDQQVEQLAERMPQVVESGLLLDILNYHTTPLGTADSRSLEDLRAFYNHRSEELEGVLAHCTDLYLLSSSGHKMSLTHDTLAPLVQKAFRESDAPGQRAYRILDNKMTDFKEDQSDTTLDPMDLELVEKGEEGMRSWEPRERELVRLSRIRKDREERAAKRRQFMIAAFLVALGISGIVAWGFKVEADTQRSEAVTQREKADSNRGVAVRQREIADSNRVEADTQRNRAFRQEKIALYERDNARYQERVARSEAYSNEARLFITQDDPKSLGTAQRAWNTLQSDRTYGVMLEAYHHSPVPNTHYQIQTSEAFQAHAASASLPLQAAARGSGAIDLLDDAGTLLKTLSDHNQQVKDVALSSKHLASVSQDKSLRIYQLPDLLPSGQIEAGDNPIAISLHPNLREAYVLSKETVNVFSIEGEPRLVTSIELNKEGSCMVLSPDGSTLMVGYPNGTVEKRNSRDGTLIKSISDVGERINRIVFSQKGNRFIVLSNEYFAMVYDKAGNILHDYIRHELRLLAATFFDNDQYIATAGADKHIHIWDAASGKKLISLKGHTDEVFNLSYDEDKKELISASKDGSIRSWPLEGRHKEVYVIQDGHSPVPSATFWGDQDRTLVAFNSKNLLSPAGFSVSRGGGNNIRGSLTKVEVSPNHTFRAAGSTRGEVLLWAGNSEESSLLEYPEKKLFAVNDLYLSRKYLAAAGKRSALVWDLSGKPINEFSQEGKKIDIVAISPDEATLFTYSAGTDEARIWRITDGKLLNSLSLPLKPQDIVFLPNGREVLLEVNPNTLSVMNVFTGSLRNKSFKHTDRIHSMALSPDGNILLTASGAEWYIWNLEDASLIHRQTGHEGPITDVAFSKSGKRILTSSDDGTVRTWLIDPKALNRK